MAELKLVISGDVKQAEQALKSFVSGVDQAAGSTTKLGSNISVLEKRVAGFGGEAQKFSSSFANSFNVIPNSINQAGQALKSFDGNLAQAGVSIKQVAAESNKTATAFTSVSSAYAKSSDQIVNSSGAAVRAVREIDLSSAGASAENFGVKLTGLERQIQAFGGGVRKFATTLSTSFTALPETINQAGTATSKLASNMSVIERQVAAFGGGVKSLSATLVSSFGAIPASINEAGAATGKFSTNITDLERRVALFGGGVKTFTSTVASSFGALPPSIDKVGVAAARLGTNIATLENQVAAFGSKTFSSALLSSFTVLTPAIDQAGASATRFAAGMTTLEKQVAFFGGGVKNFSSALVGSFNQIPTSIDQVGRSLKTFESNVNTTVSAVRPFSTELTKSFGTLPVNNINTLRQAIIALKADLTNVKISAIPPIEINTAPAKQSLKSLTDDAQRSGVIISQSLDRIPLDGINNFRKAFLDFKADLSNVKITAIPDVNIEPAKQALKNLTVEAQKTGIIVSEAFSKVFDFKSLKIEAIPPIKVDVTQASQSLRILSSEAQKTGAAINTVSTSADRFSVNIIKSLGVLPLHNIETFRKAFLNLKSDLSSVKIAAIPPLDVNVEPAKQSLRSLAGEAQRTGAILSGSSSSAARTFAAAMDISVSASGKLTSNLSALEQRVALFGGGVKTFSSVLSNSFTTLPTTINQAGQALKTVEGNIASIATQSNKTAGAFVNVSSAYAKAASQISASSQGAVQAIKQIDLSGATRPAIQAVSKLGDSLETLRAKLLAKQSFIITETDIQKVAVLNTEIKQLEGEIIRVTNAGKAGFDNMGRAIRPQVGLLDKLTRQAEIYKRGITQATLPANIIKYNQKLEQTNAQIVKLSNIGRTGFDNLGASVLKTSGSFDALSKGASKGFGALRMLANIIPGIGIGSLIGFLTQSVAGLFSMGSAAKETTQRIKELVVSIEDISSIAATGTEDELAKVRALANAVLDQNKSYTERNNALLQLKKINESYFGDLTLEAAQLGILKDRVNEYTAAIINQAVIKAFSDNIGKIAVELSKQEKAFNEAGAEVKKYTEAVDGANKATESQRALTPFGVSPVVGIQSELKDLDKAKDKFKEQGKIVGTLRNQMAELRTAIQDAVNTSLDLRPLEIAKPKGAKDAENDLEKFISRAKQLAAELEKIGFIAPAEFSFFDTFNEQLIKAKKVFDDFEKGNLKIQPRIFTFPSFSEPDIKQRTEQALDVVAQAIKDGVIRLPDIELEVNISPEFAQNVNLLNDPVLKKIFSDIGRAIPPIDLEMPAGFNESVLLQQLRDFFKVSGDVTKEGLASLAADFAKGIDNINSVFRSIQLEGINLFGEALGTALGGGDIKGIFDGFVNIIADGLSAIGKQMIALSPVIVALKSALKSLNPAVLLPAGIALVAIGAALRASVKKGVTGFAEGGLVFGPTIGLVGEGVGTSRSNPEVIAPLDQLKKMLGDVTGTHSLQVVVVGRLRGKDQILQSARTSKSQRRLG